MSENGLTALRRVFIDRYDELRKRLTPRLGSADLASEALQETWLRLSRLDAQTEVKSPGSYLFRTVLNVAFDQRESAKRHLTAVEVDMLLNLADDVPDPHQITQARSDLRAMKSVLAELPARRRAILLAARVDGLPLQTIASKLGVSLRLISKELRLAHEYIVARREELGRGSCANDE
jgi:RNA polymerase sigma factor (sigma-70 family)